MLWLTRVDDLWTAGMFSCMHHEAGHTTHTVGYMHGNMLVFLKAAL